MNLKKILNNEDLKISKEEKRLNILKSMDIYKCKNNNNYYFIYNDNKYYFKKLEECLNFRENYLDNINKIKI